MGEKLFPPLGINVRVAEMKDNILKAILRLHRDNTTTLGFLPEQVFNNSIKENKVLIATDDNQSVIGYLLYDFRTRTSYISITHLCIEKEHRNKGIAKALFNYLADKYRYDFSGIKVVCRGDYKEATRLWEKLHFIHIGEKPGRSAKGSVLYTWIYELKKPKLNFSENNNQKLRVVLDTNVIINLEENEFVENKTSDSILYEPWLIEEVEYCIVPQLRSDILHRDDQAKRDKTFKFISERFKELKPNSSDVDNIYNELLLSEKRNFNDRDFSDIRHIAQTVSAKVQFFITNEDNFPLETEKIKGTYNVQILRPEEFVVKYSEIINQNDYQPVYFSGSKLNTKRLEISDLRIITKSFNIPGEKSKQLKKRLLSYLNEIDTSIYIIYRDSDHYFLYVKKIGNDTLEIPLLRYTNKRDVKTIIIQVVKNFIEEAIIQKKKYIKLYDPSQLGMVTEVLEQFNFVRINDGFVRFIDPIVVDINELSNYLNVSISKTDFQNQYFTAIKKYVDDSENIFALENILFPLKIIGTNIPCYLIPIKPLWAMNLFYLEASENDLFGASDPERLLFNSENAYYRASNPNPLIQNSRILWYLSKSDDKHYRSKCITSTSYLKEINIGNAKELFKKYSRLGVYKWEDVIETAKNNHDKKIMAFLFDNTFNLPHPVSLPDIREMGKNFDISINFQTPFKIPELLYFDILKKGMFG